MERDNLKIAVFHYWLINWRGGEKVLSAILNAYPDADVYTHVLDRKVLPSELQSREIRTTFIQKLPFSRRFYKAYLPLMPLALESLDLTSYDLVISSEAGPAKGFICRPDAIHVSYTHSPMRYIWDLWPTYSKNLNPLVKVFFLTIAHYLRIWDYTCSQRVDYFIANSSFVKSRIEKYFCRSSKVIWPPVQVRSFEPSSSYSDYYLFVGEFVEYKKYNFAIEACLRKNQPLVLIGRGVPKKLLKKSKLHPQIRFLTDCGDVTLRDFMARCKALLFPGIEDFGIVPIEVMATGRPVIALAAGGSLDYVEDGLNGVLYTDDSVDGLVCAMDRFEREELLFSSEKIRNSVDKFSSERFSKEFTEFIESKIIQNKNMERKKCL